MSARQIRFSLVLGQRLPWPVLQANAMATEAFGFDGLYLVDHLLGRLDVREPTHEGYTALGAIAATTTRVRLGLMVAGNTYRNPVLLLKQAITVDHIARGRVDFGVGAGWAEREHEAYSFEFPSAGERVDRFAEALAIWKSLQHNQRTTIIGDHYQVIDAPLEPKSLQGALPVLIGGTKPRMLRLVAEYADIWNGGGNPDEAGALNRQLTEICEAAGRDPDAIERSVSPALNLLESTDAFRAGVDAYIAAGFTHITLPWPREDAEVHVLQDIAALHLQDYRPNPPAPDPFDESTHHVSTARGLHDYGYPPREGGDLTLVRETLGEHSDWPLIVYLAERPETVVPPEEIRAALPYEDHRAISLAFAALGDRLASRGIRRIWIEGPRGWSIERDIAAVILAD